MSSTPSEAPGAPAPGASFTDREKAPIQRASNIQRTSNAGNTEPPFGDDFPAYSVGRAARVLGTTHAFLRSLDAAKLLTRTAQGEGIAGTRAVNSV